METYKLFVDIKGNTIGVRRGSDGASIPNAPDNKDWAVYQDWLKAGNQPAPADDLSVDAVAIEQAQVDAKAIVLNSKASAASRIDALLVILGIQS